MESKLPRWISIQFFFAFFSLLLLLYMFLLEPFWVVTEQVILPGSRLMAPLPSGRFLFLSDFHSTGFGFREKKAIAEAERVSPSFVLLGGGFGGDSSLEAVAMFSKELTQKRSVYSVLQPEDQGNQRLVDVLRQSGVVVLDNARAEFRTPQGIIDLIGVTWPGALPRLADTRDQSRPAIVLGGSVEIANPIEDAFLLEVASNPSSGIADWQITQGTWRFTQPSTVTIEKSGTHRLRVQRAIPGMLLAEVRFVAPNGTAVVVKADTIGSGAFRGGFQRIPASAYGKEGYLVDVSSSEPSGAPLTSAQKAPVDFFETSVSLPAGLYTIEALVRPKDRNQGAIWLQIEDGRGESGGNRYALDKSFSVLDSTSKVDLVLAGGTLGGQIRPLSALGALFSKTTPYVSGLYQPQDVPFYVSRGLGTHGVPARFFSRPEVTVFSF